MYSAPFLKNLYRTMARIRACEEILVEPILKKEIRGPVHLYTGEEAIATGVCAALKESDLVFGNHRSHGHYLAKGGEMKELLAEIYGKEAGCSRGRGGSMHVIAKEKGFLGATPIVAGTISLATGAALSLKIRKTKNAVVSFFGDGATGEGVLYESLNFASLKKLPILFACENNFYSTHLPLKEIRSKDNIFEIAKPFGIFALRIDGNDVLRVYEAAKTAISLIRKGKGPAFIEFRTYRLRGHVGPDDNIQGGHTDIRPAGEIKSWQAKDPLKRFAEFILKNNYASQDDLDKINQEAKEEAETALAFAQNSPYPLAHELLRDVFK
ncbi:MAG: thiamine pyrophosphate-dependent dehydrogenase E1 component subunit alpha [bacterium]